MSINFSESTFLVSLSSESTFLVSNLIDNYGNLFDEYRGIFWKKNKIILVKSSRPPVPVAEGS